MHATMRNLSWKMAYYLLDFGPESYETIIIFIYIDPKGQLNYAQGCYKFGCYAEADAVCSELIESITPMDEEDKQKIKCMAKLLKGKAVFHCYQRKMMYYMVEKSEISKPDEKTLINECFRCISESIDYLGTALDEVYIDQEGSRLLDWAMIDCTRETKWLNQCKRCFLCRRFDDHLCRSHVFPKFLLEGGKSIFGQDKHQLKSPGECWIWLCCRRCESIMTQNAENDFSKRFSSTGSVEYTSWLFNYCCTILFRTFTCMKFPLTFNDDEIYEAFLSCRKHLLSLPVKMKNVDLTPTKMENYQLQLLSAVVTEKIKPYLFVLPEIYFERKEGVFEKGMLDVNTFCCLSLRRLIDGREDLASRPHFFVAYSNGIVILLPFSPSAQCMLPKSCCIPYQSGTYTISGEREAVELIPKGLLWVLHLESVDLCFPSLTEALRQLTPLAADKMVVNRTFAEIYDRLKNIYIPEAIDDESGRGSGVPDVLTIPFPLIVKKQQISMLPPDFRITDSFSSIQLPSSHQIVLHHVENSYNLTIFLVVGDSGGFSLDKPYIIYLFENSSKTHSYVDAIFIKEVAEKISFTTFLLEHSIYNEIRGHLADVQEHARALVSPMLSRNKFLSLEMFMHYLKCRWFCTDVDNMPSLDLKCSSTGCWYCQGLCHYCMKPALWIKIDDLSPDQQYRFCSKKCNEIFCVAPSVTSKSIFVTDHRGRFPKECPSVLGIIKVSKEEESTHNTVEFFNLCIRDGSEDLSQGPYILWQVRLIDSQEYRNFFISDECIPTGVLWPNHLENEEAITHLEEFQPHLSKVLEYSLKEFAYEDLATYLKDFIEKESNKAVID